MSLSLALLHFLPSGLAHCAFNIFRIPFSVSLSRSLRINFRRRVSLCILRLSVWFHLRVFEPTKPNASRAKNIIQRKFLSFSFPIFLYSDSHTHSSLVVSHAHHCSTSFCLISLDILSALNQRVVSSPNSYTIFSRWIFRCFCCWQHTPIQAL